MSSQSAGGGGSKAQARKSFSVITVIKGLPKTVISALSIEDVVTSCRRCRGRIRHGEEFCSQFCAVNYWGRLRQENGKASGTYLIMMIIQLWLAIYGLSGGGFFGRFQKGTGYSYDKLILIVFH